MSASRSSEADAEARPGPPRTLSGRCSGPIATPRLARPRTAVPAGAVGIGGEQTGIYPLPTPGGWRIIGRTPLRLYDPAAPEPFLLRAGDILRPRPIEATEFATLAEQVATGRYRPEIVAGE